MSSSPTRQYLLSEETVEADIARYSAHQNQMEILSGFVPFSAIADKLTTGEGDWVEVGLYSAFDLLALKSIGTVAQAGSKINSASRNLMRAEAGLQMGAAGYQGFRALQAGANEEYGGLAGRTFMAMLHAMGAKVNLNRLRQLRKAEVTAANKLIDNAQNIKENAPITSVPRNLTTGKPIDVFLDGQQRMVATFNPETGNLFINKIGMGNLKGLGRSHEAYADAIKQAGERLKTISGKMASDNIKALKAAGMDVSKTASARALSKLGFTEHFLIEVMENGKKVYYRVSRRP